MSYRTENGEVPFSAVSVNGVKRKESLVQWLNDVVPNLRLRFDASEEELRACLFDGSVFCGILSRLCPGFANEDTSNETRASNITSFLEAMDEMGLPTFELSDLEQGSFTTVLECLWALRSHFDPNLRKDASVTAYMAKTVNQQRKRWELSEIEPLEGNNGYLLSSRGENGMVFADDRRKNLFENPVESEPSAAQLRHAGQKFNDVFQLKEGKYADIPVAKISEMMKSYSLSSAKTKSLLSVVNAILDEGIDTKNGEIPHRVACLLRKVVQEIERRISTQAEQMRTQKNLFMAREEKYRSRIRVLETLVTGTTEETQIVVNKLQEIKTEKSKLEENKKLEEQEVVKLFKEKDHSLLEISALKQELELTKKTYEHNRMQIETQAKETQFELEERLRDLDHLLTDSRKKEKELEEFAKSKAHHWKKKEHTYRNFVDSQFKALQDLRLASGLIKNEVVKTHKSYSEEFGRLGAKLRGLADAVQNYHSVLEENRRLYNEVQDLKGNIRVYCRVRPFLHGQSKKQTAIDYIGENGEVVVANPSKLGKENHRLFKFNKVYGPTTTQEEVFLDTQPLIRSVLDGYNVCIFAYGQTGSGKTYTMSGPRMSSKEDWGVNYRALNDLFDISQKRKSAFTYEVAVQMVEIYNEQVRDLLSSDVSQKRLGIWTSSQPNGLAVPGASMLPVKSTTDVLDLMKIGEANRAVGSTALNERSSRSHSVLTVHIRGTELETGAALRGSLHLVDLAGSERVDRSEVTGDRLKEAQHINKSLSALGDVIFALAQKSSHVPYRNSKLTQVLQSSLGGQAKTLMFVQLNPDVDSYAETISTLKFAERVSGVELGAARSNKEGRDVRELMEQVAALKDSLAQKEEEIERLQLLKDLKNVSSCFNGEKDTRSSFRSRSSPLTKSPAGIAQRGRRLSGGKSSGSLDRTASDQGNCSDHSDKHSEAGSQQSLDDFQHQKEFFQRSKPSLGDPIQNFSADDELIGFGDADSEERLSDISDGGLSMGTETDASISSVVEFTLFPEGSKPPLETPDKTRVPSKIPRPPSKPGQTTLSKSSSSSKDFSKVLPSSKKTPTRSSSSKTPKRVP